MVNSWRFFFFRVAIIDKELPHSERYYFARTYLDDLGNQRGERIVHALALKVSFASIRPQIRASARSQDEGIGVTVTS